MWTSEAADTVQPNPYGITVNTSRTAAAHEVGIAALAKATTVAR